MQRVSVTTKQIMVGGPRHLARRWRSFRSPTAPPPLPPHPGRACSSLLVLRGADAERVRARMRARATSLLAASNWWGASGVGSHERQLVGGVGIREA